MNRSINRSLLSICWLSIYQSLRNSLSNYFKSLTAILWLSNNLLNHFSLFSTILKHQFLNNRISIIMLRSFRLASIFHEWKKNFEIVLKFYIHIFRRFNSIQSNSNFFFQIHIVIEMWMNFFVKNDFISIVNVINNKNRSFNIS